MKPIIKNHSFQKRIIFYTLVTRLDEYSEMIESAKKAGFDRDDIDFFYFDNKNSNDFDGYSGINYVLRDSKSEYIIFCHQDIIFNFDGYEKFIKCIDELNSIDPKWAIAGNAGKTKDGRSRRKISDPHGVNQTFGPFPAKVISIDENFIVINNKYNVSCSYHISGFHLYGIDLCLNAINLGLSCYVIDFHLTHKSKGNLDKSFFKNIRHLRNIIEFRKKPIYYSTTCYSFFVTNSKIFNFLLNLKIIRMIFTKIIEK
ncbi:acyl esterase [Acinetobacter soli]|uniref:acyl esterase n=1 Tax=Acinetobacter soli TaxID=487316 RepID=UPI000CE34AF8|nr:acyl esterase [Acinetobacter soli]PPB85798.1 hypothetical protein AsoHEU7_13030 [Acinetobacter soli]